MKRKYCVFDAEGVLSSKWCSGCDDYLIIDNFVKDKQTGTGYKAYCKDCCATRLNAYTDTRTGFLKRLIRGTKSNIKQKKRSLPPPTLTIEEFEAKLAASNDCCMYSGLPLNFQPFSDWQASPERMVNADTYTGENTIPIILEMNTGADAKWNAEKARYAATHQDTPVSAEKIELICYSIINKNNKKLSAYERQLGKDWSFRMQKVVGHARARSIKMTKKGRVGFEECDIDIDSIVELFREQQGLCAYSGICLTPYRDWKLSLERINVQKGYLKGNVCLIATEFNSSDSTVRIKDPARLRGAGGWTALKYQHFRKNFAL
jgi:hypothetical protein